MLKIAHTKAFLIAIKMINNNNHLIHKIKRYSPLYLLSCWYFNNGNELKCKSFNWHKNSAYTFIFLLLVFSSWFIANGIPFYHIVTLDDWINVIMCTLIHFFIFSLFLLDFYEFHCPSLSVDVNFVDFFHANLSLWTILVCWIF